MKRMYEYVDKKTGKNAALLADDVYEIIMANADTLG
jgi:ribonucleoside-diphosphate reductase alpha chain